MPGGAARCVALDPSACLLAYRQAYRQEAQAVCFCPYRVSPLGAHVDHQGGPVHGFAIDKGIYLAYRAEPSGQVTLRSANFPGQLDFSLGEIPPKKAGDWADHLRGAALLLSQRQSLTVGLSAFIQGTLPIGGLSSSASVIIAFLQALCRLNDVTLSSRELIDLAQAVENRYVGVSCGKLDQSCEVLSRKDQLLYLDTLDDSFELIPTPAGMKPYEIAVFFSGLSRSLAGSGYNLRLDECRAAGYSLMAYAGLPYGAFDQTKLRDIPRGVFEAYRDRLPQAWARRAEHYYSEVARVEAGTNAWRAGDLEGYGQLIFRSGYSAIHSYECGCEQLITLYEILRDTPGIYGGCFSGAGFKGCCMALIDPEQADSIQHQVASRYLAAYPELKDRYSFHLCRSADGIQQQRSEWL